MCLFEVLYFILCYSKATTSLGKFTPAWVTTYKSITLELPSKPADSFFPSSYHCLWNCGEGQEQEDWGREVRYPRRQERQAKGGRVDRAEGFSREQEGTEGAVIKTEPKRSLSDVRGTADFPPCTASLFPVL